MTRNQGMIVAWGTSGKCVTQTRVDSLAAALRIVWIIAYVHMKMVHDRPPNEANQVANMARCGAEAAWAWFCPECSFEVQIQ